MKLTKNKVTVGFELEGIFASPHSDDVIKTEWGEIVNEIKGDGSVNISSYERDRLIAPCELELTTNPIKWGSKQYNQYFKLIDRQQKKRRVMFNKTCGLHFHFCLHPEIKLVAGSVISKQIHESWENLIKTKYSHIWAARKENQYCTPLEGKNPRLYETRYRAINYGALFKYKTIECRFYGCLPGQHKVDGSEYKTFVDDTINLFLTAYNSVDQRKALFCEKINLLPSEKIEYKREIKI